MVSLAWHCSILRHLIGDLRYITAAEKTLHAAWSSIEQIPYAHNTLLLGLEEFLDPAPVVIIRGGSDQIQHWQQEIFRSGLLGRGQVFAIPNDEENLPGLLAERKVTNETTAYLCSAQSCLPPISKLKKLLLSLKH